MADDILLAAADASPLPTWSLRQILSVVAILVGITIVCFGVATLFQYYKWHTSPWYSDRYYASSHIWDWLSSLTSSSRITSQGGIQEVDIPLEKPMAPATESTSERHPEPPSESWCFVGEDLTGRYCVKVPSASSCEASRYFPTRSDCELQKANALPAGVVTASGGMLDLN
jgi:hypothetical protein